MRSVIAAIATSVVLVQGFSANAQTAQSVIGLKYQVTSEPGQQPIYRNLPKGLKPLSSGLIGNTAADKPYAVATYQRGDRQVLWLEQAVSRTAIRRPDGYFNDITWQVFDAVTLPSGTSVLGGTTCYRNGKADSTLIPVLSKQMLRRNDREWYTTFEQMWKANLQTKKFEKVKPQGIRCENPAWGV